MAKSRTDAPAAAPPPGTWPAQWWHALDDGRIQCDLCLRDCRLHEGHRGACFVRMRDGDRMVLTTYGRSSGFCIDPIEKKPLNHFLPERIAYAARQARHGTAGRQAGCRSVAFTYNDPVIFAEYAMDTADACRSRGLKTVAVTTGYIHDTPRRAFFEKMDAANVDLKAFTDDFYVRLTGSRLAPVLDTLKYLIHETEVWVEITTLLIPTKNDSDEELKRLCGWIADALGPTCPSTSRPSIRTTS
jgi:pyruvate formate lyase activating enzyme